MIIVPSMRYAGPYKTSPGVTEIATVQQYNIIYYLHGKNSCNDKF